jgi:Na+-translocating ferredoxin:NAD+ oxidoreductase RnfA subunit
MKLTHAVPVILTSSSFNDFVKKLNYEIIIAIDKDYFSNYIKQKKPYKSMTTFMPDISYTNLILKILLFKQKREHE